MSSGGQEGLSRNDDSRRPMGTCLADVAFPAKFTFGVGGDVLVAEHVAVPQIEVGQQHPVRRQRQAQPGLARREMHLRARPIGRGQAGPVAKLPAFKARRDCQPNGWVADGIRNPFAHLATHPADRRPECAWSSACVAVVLADGDQSSDVGRVLVRPYLHLPFCVRISGRLVGGG